MTVSIFFTIALCIASGFLASALTRSTMNTMIAGALEGIPDEEFRSKHGITAAEGLLMEVSAATLAYTLSILFGGGTAVIWTAAFSAVAVAAIYMDLREHVLPNVLVYPLYLITALGLVAYWHQSGTGVDFIIGAFAGGLFSLVLYLGLWFLSGCRLGFGDVRLSAIIGALVGGFGAGMPVAAIFLANVLALVFALLGVLLRVRNSTNQIAFGPFMFLGATTALIFQQQIMDWWNENTEAVVWLFNGMPM